MKISLQDYSDSIVAPEYRQPLKTVREACAMHNWDFADKPICCGREVSTDPWIFGAVYAGCEVCGKFIRDMSAPIVEGGCARCIDGEKIDLDTERTWIAGQRQIEEPKQSVGDERSQTAGTEA